MLIILHQGMPAIDFSITLLKRRVSDDAIMSDVFTTFHEACRWRWLHMVRKRER